VIPPPSPTRSQNSPSRSRRQPTSAPVRATSASRSSSVRKIASSGCTSYDSGFISRFIGSNVRVSLQRLSLLNRDATSSTLLIHDLICSAVWSEQADGTELANEIERYICAYNGEMVPNVLRQIHLSADQLLATHRRRGARNPDWLMYGILQLAEYPQRAELVDALYDREMRSTAPIVELLCIIDSKETYSYSLSRAAKASYYSCCAEMYGNIAETTSDPDVRAEMLHHKGKALRRSGRLADARECFQQLATERPKWHATYGQIAHVGLQKQATSDDKLAGEQAIRYLVGEILNDVYAVPLRVSLALVSKLRSYPSVTQELMNNEACIQQLAQVIALAALEGFDQFYEAFVAFTSLFGFNYGHICLGIAEISPDMMAISPSAVNSSQWQNACEALTNIARVADFSDRLDLSAKLRSTAVIFAERICQQEHQNQYEMRAAAKTFIATGNPSRALEAISTIQENAKDHWILYQQGKAEVAISLPESVTTATRALALAIKDSRALTRLPSYYELLSDCQENCGDVQGALASIEDAINRTDNPKYRNSLICKKERMLKLAELKQ
jgi:tetratricopeptide (TPR) repeat protein